LHLLGLERRIVLISNGWFLLRHVRFLFRLRRRRGKEGGGGDSGRCRCRGDGAKAKHLQE
jgi:hypothetical protein